MEHHEYQTMMAPNRPTTSPPVWSSEEQVAFDPCHSSSVFLLVYVGRENTSDLQEVVDI